MITPAVVIRPIDFCVVNHRAPSGPTVMPSLGPIRLLVYVVTTPLVVILPIMPMELTMPLVNHSAPSGPAVIPTGWSIPALV